MSAATSANKVSKTIEVFIMADELEYRFPSVAFAIFIVEFRSGNVGAFQVGTELVNTTLTVSSCQVIDCLVFHMASDHMQQNANFFSNTIFFYLTVHS